MEIEIARCLALSVLRRALGQVALGVREDGSRVRGRCLAAERRQPAHPPGQHAAQRDAVGRAIGRGEAHRGAPASSLDSRRLSSQRMLSFWSIGTRVGLIRRLSAAVPLNLVRDQNLAAVRPSGSPSGAIARLACIRSPQTACFLWRPSFSLRPADTFVNPTFSGAERLKENSVVSCKIGTGPSVARRRRAGRRNGPPGSCLRRHSRWKRSGGRPWCSTSPETPWAAISPTVPQGPRASSRGAGSTGHPPDHSPRFPFPPNPAPRPHLNHSAPQDKSWSCLRRQGQVWRVNQFTTRLVGNCKRDRPTREFWQSATPKLRPASTPT